VVERHTSIASDISDCLHYDHQSGIFGREQFQHWKKLPFHIAIAVKNKNWVADE
jgi:hypothetical protein